MIHPATARPFSSICFFLFGGGWGWAVVMLYQLWDSSYSSFSLSVLRANRWLDSSRTCHQLWQAARDGCWPDSGRTCHQLHMASSQRRMLARRWQNLPSAAHGKQPEMDAGRTCHQLWQAARDGHWQNLPSAVACSQRRTLAKL